MLWTRGLLRVEQALHNARLLARWRAPQHCVVASVAATQCNDAGRLFYTFCRDAQYMLALTTTKQLQNFNMSTEATGHVGEMTEAQYHKVADHTLDLLTEKLEGLVEQVDMDDCDIEYSQGVLTLRLGSKGTYVINKQTPNRQIWFSSPISGPLRYDYCNGRWVYHRDGRDMLGMLQEELTQLCGIPVDLEGEAC